MASLVPQLLLLFLASTAGAWASTSRQPVVKESNVFVTTENGELRGTVTVSLNGTYYSRFLGIPYATPPLGDLRFRAPQPAANWSGVRDAVTMSPECPQSGTGSEDCLYLNVYFPVGHDSLLPVMVHIYGGAFTTGSATNHTPDYFVDKGVMFVTFNYRVGAIGFLSLLNDDIPGNAGLKDQVLALQWVQRNIAAFGGDPTKVTIFGESAGSCSSAHMFLSPAAKGLFSGVIMESGQASSNWSVEPLPREKAYRLAAALGFQTQAGNTTVEEEDERLAAFLRAANHEDLTVDDYRALSDFEKRRTSPVAWQPVIEPPSASAVVTEPPIRILTEGRYNHVPVMTGATSADGSVFVGMSGVMESESVAADLNENFTSLVGSLLPRPTRPEQAAAAQQLEDFYFGDQGLSQQQPQAVYDLLSDLYFIQDTQAFARTVANTSTLPIYFYYFDYDGYGATEYGMAHAQETHYLFMQEGPNKDPESDDWKVLQLLATLWTNFAKYRDPAPSGSPVTWEKYNAAASNYLHIRLESETRQDLLHDRTDLWRRILPV